MKRTAQMTEHVNDYQINTPDGASFRVSALDSDHACREANRYAVEHSILSCRATLGLLQDGPQSACLNLGYFDLEGYELPSSWSELKAVVSWAREEAVKDAFEDWDYSFHRSRGVVITAQNQKGEAVVSTAEAWSLPSTLKEFKRELATLMQNNPEIVTVWAVAAVNGANTVEAINHDPEPCTGEKAVLIWHRDYPQGTLDIVLEDDPLAETQSTNSSATMEM